MKKIFILFISVMALSLAGCNSDEPEVTATGWLIVHLEQPDAAGDVDFSEYSVAVVPEHGFIASAPMKDITWPVEALVGNYKVAACSPLVSETGTDETYYYGEVKDVRIFEDRTTEVTITLKLQTFPKNVWE